MTIKIQLLCNGIGGKVHARWAFDPILGFPDGGFDIYRRNTGRQGAWLTLAYQNESPLRNGDYTIRWSSRSSTGDAPHPDVVGGAGVFIWDTGELRFFIGPQVAHIAVYVGHLHPARVPARSPIPTGTPSITASRSLGPSGVNEITLTALSSTGTEVHLINPPYGLAIRVEFTSTNVYEVRIEGVRVYITGFEIWVPGVAGSWGTPLNGSTPIKLPRSDTSAKLSIDIAARLTAAEFSGWFGTPVDTAALDELRTLVENCQPDPAAPPGPRWITKTDVDGTRVSVDPKGLLLTLALRPLIARALGLYWIDTIAVPGVVYDYRIEGHWGPGSPRWAQIGTIAQEFIRISTNTTYAPGNISSLTARSAETRLVHPLSGRPRPIYVRMTAAHLDWTVPLRSSTNLIDFESVFYYVERQLLGLLVPPQLPPPLPDPSLWTTLNANVPQLVAVDQHHRILHPIYRDSPPDVYSAFEGWYAYRIRGVNIFEVTSVYSPVANVLQLDNIAPPAPSALLGPSAGIERAHNVELSWSWGPDEALSSPDSASFRIYLQERTPNILNVTTGNATVNAAAGQAVLPISGAPLPADAPTRLLGSKLDVDGISYLILNATAGGSQSVTIALSKSSAPPPDRPGSITYLCAPDNVWNMRILSASVKPYTTCTISGATLAGGVVNATIYPVASRGAATRGAAIYDRASGNTFTVETIPAAAGVSMLIPSSNFGSNTSLPDGDALIFPRQKVTIPDPFTAGSDLRYGYFAVSTADAASYKQDRITTGSHANIPGNEGPPSLPLTVLVYDSTPPPTPTGGPDPDGPNVYATPPDYYSRSYYTLQWTSTPGLRYQVFRALDKSIFAADAGRGAGRRYQDSDYPTLTNRQLADLAGEFDNIYLIRTSVPVLGNTFKDELPGSGPNRFVYRIAAINDAGMRSALSASWAPVWIPDTIPPSKPQIKNITVDEGLLILRWTQPNAELVSYFNLYRTTKEPNTIDKKLMGQPKELFPSLMRTNAGVFEYEDRTVADGVHYSYRVVAIRYVTSPAIMNVESVQSDVIKGKALKNPDPAVFSSASWDSSKKTVSLSWTQEEGITSTVYRSYDGLNWQLASVRSRDETGYLDNLSQEAGRNKVWYMIKSVTPNGRYSESAAEEVSLL